MDDNNKPVLDGGKPQMTTVMSASSSRLIALIGFSGIFLIYVGSGLIIIRNYALSNTLPTEEALKGLENFLLAGITMFEPYFVNKFSSVFDWLRPGKM